MMAENTVILEVDERGVATLTINRPEIHNAFDDLLINRLLQALESVEVDPKVRVAVLRSEGKSFSAGADLNWMRRMADYSEAENLADARRLAKLMERLNSLSKPTIAQVQGAAFGGGVGLVACCDMAVAAEGAKFCLSEVRLGLIPAVISPYVIAAIGERAARRYFLTAERFDAAEAHRLGLLHAVVPEAQLASQVDALIDELLKGGPCSQAAAKSLIFAVAHQPAGAAVIDDTAKRITAARASDEGKEGLNAFLNKRAPAWISEDKS
ncbi:enoyl-CoA hydratase/isomerase family protein [Sedimenticola sp.]|uniref:enoyl-CoA hydratase/isomerase family protein n=2 Tax=Sedimenticola sp. TaxID=1940285 RepID=UPI003D0FE14A